VNADWPMYRSDPSHSGVGTSNPNGTNALEPTVLWQQNLTFPPSLLTVTNVPAYEVPGFVPDIRRGMTEPMVADGLVYVGASSETYWGVQFFSAWIDVYAFSASDGSKLWGYRQSGLMSELAVADGMLYFGSDNNHLYALNASTGSLVWNDPNEGSDRSPPVVSNGVIYVPGGEGISALAASNGSVIWQDSINSNVHSAYPAISNGLVYFNSLDGVYAFNAGNGDEVWNYTSGDGFFAPTVSGGVLYAATRSNMFAFNAADGKKLWNYSVNLIGGLATDNDTLYSTSGESTLYALAVKGTKIWSYNDSTDYAMSAPALVDDTVYFGTDTNLYAVNAANGHLVWNYSDGYGFGDPVVVDGVLYVVSNQQVYALQIPSSTIESKPENIFLQNILIAVVVPVLILIIAISIFLFRRHRKTTNQKNQVKKI
jgi:outer membrane protein assembly factor BamB